MNNIGDSEPNIQFAFFGDSEHTVIFDCSLTSKTILLVCWQSIVKMPTVHTTITHAEMTTAFLPIDQGL